MREEFERTGLLLGEEGVNRLQNAHVAVFGVGGVGGFAVEALARAGVGTLTIVDHDTVSRSNINRQIVADHSTVGQLKVKIMEERIHKINPRCKVIVRDCFYLPENAETFRFEDYDYIIDAIDTVTGKLQLVEQAKKVNTPIICCMGAGNKLDPTQFEVADIEKTSVCPLAKVMRRELKNRGIRKVKVLYSKEPPIKAGRTPGSVSFVPSVAGLILAGEVIKCLAFC